MTRKRAREDAAATMVEEPTMLVMMTMMAPSNEYQNQMLAHPTTPSPTWKLYHNPFYSPSLNTHHLHCTPTNHPPSLELATAMNELDLAKALVEDLKAEVELERRMRKRAEAASKKLAREVAEAREAGERAREEMERLKKEVEEERRMLRMAEVWREERVQMKMADARLLMEEKLAELAGPKDANHDNNQQLPPPPIPSPSPSPPPPTSSSSSTAANCLVLKQGSCQRKGSPESENPHIVRGIKGYVEFPRVIRAVSSRGKPMGSKVECQKAQLKLLLRHRSPVAVVAGANSVTVG